ncbi:hypothetical protein KW783_00605 [Candidatus Parcubacteria bacterium]|nr:hypothetical protein [Candidatus Parcubacteria bacterium]
MESRTQSKGKQKPWTLDEISAGLKSFFDEHGRYPTATEVDLYQFLPSARSIERRFGGLIKVREMLNLNSQSDFRNGKHRSDRAYLINKRGHNTENEVYQYLLSKFGKEFVHREFFFTDDKRTRADFFVYDQTGGFCVDVFYPSDRRNVTGCLNGKLNKYTSNYMRQYPVIFLQMNREIPQSILDTLVANKKKSLVNGQSLMSWDAFKAFCNTRKPLSIKKSDINVA